MRRDHIIDVLVVGGDGGSGDWHDRTKGHWLIDS
jgi:hypothetical protein